MRHRAEREVEDMSEINSVSFLGQKAFFAWTRSSSSSYIWSFC